VGKSLLEAYVAECGAKQPVQQATDQETYQRAVYADVLQVFADAQFQSLDYGVGVPVGDYLGDEVG
jgi:hypothetical protein